MDDEKRDNQVIDIESVLPEDEVERTCHAGKKARQSTVLIIHLRAYYTGPHRSCILPVREYPSA